MAARPWSEALEQALAVGKDARDIDQCDFCGNHHVCACCDNRECPLAPQFITVVHRPADLFDPIANAKAMLRYIQDRYGDPPSALWERPYDPAEPLRGGDPRMFGSGYDSQGRYWHGTEIEWG